METEKDYLKRLKEAQGLKEDPPTNFVPSKRGTAKLKMYNPKRKYKKELKLKNKLKRKKEKGGHKS